MSTINSNTNNKSMVTAAAIGAGASLLSSGLGGLFSQKSTKSANATNLQINRENNAANLRLAQMQNEWNLAQWNRENAYNSPYQQVQRLRAAGLNPSVMQMDVGNTSANLQSANLANQQATQVQPTESSFWQGLANGVPAAATAAQSALIGKQGQLMDAQIQNIKTDSLIKQVDAYVKNAKKDFDIDTSKALLEQIKQNTATSKAQEALTYWQERTEQHNSTIAFWRANVEKSSAPYKVKSARMEYLNLCQDLNNKTAQELATYESINLTRTQKIQIEKDLELNPLRALLMGAQAYAARVGANAQMVNANANMLNAETNSFNGDKQRQLWDQDIENRKADTFIKQVTGQDLHYKTLWKYLNGAYQYEGSHLSRYKNSIVHDIGNFIDMIVSPFSGKSRQLTIDNYNLGWNVTYGK